VLAETDFWLVPLVDTIKFPSSLGLISYLSPPELQMIPGIRVLKIFEKAGIYCRSVCFVMQCPSTTD